jgi:hypothetical protein
MQMATLSSKCAIVFTEAVRPAPVEAEEVAKTDRPSLGGPPSESTPSTPASSTRSGSCDHPPAVARAHQDRRTSFSRTLFQFDSTFLAFFIKLRHRARELLHACPELLHPRLRTRQFHRRIDDPVKCGCFAPV